MHNIDSKKAVIIKAGTAAFLIAALLTGTTACGKEKEHGSNATQTPVSVATPTMIPTPAILRWRRDFIPKRCYRNRCCRR